MAQYRYAYDKKGLLIDVTQLPDERSQLGDYYVCIGCGDPLIPKTRGKRREKHFAHKVENASCTRETYLHKLGKQTFYEVYSECLLTEEPFTIVMSHKSRCSVYKSLLGGECSIHTVKRSHPLTQYYDQVCLERRDEQFIPDLILFSSADKSKKIYVEIAVTHSSSPEKLASNNRIIEIPIETEDDVEKIRTHCISERMARFVNFDPKLIEITSKEECECAKYEHYCLYIYKSGKCFLQQAALEEIEKQKQQVCNSLIYSKLELAIPGYSMDAGHVFVRLLRNAFYGGVPLRNCFLCKYAGENWSSQSDAPIYCKFLKQPCASDKAIACQYFRTNPNDRSIA